MPEPWAAIVSFGIAGVPVFTLIWALRRRLDLRDAEFEARKWRIFRHYQEMGWDPDEDEWEKI